VMGRRWRPDKREERGRRDEEERGPGEVLWKCCGLRIIVLTEILES